MCMLRRYMYMYRYINVIYRKLATKPVWSRLSSLAFRPGSVFQPLLFLYQCYLKELLLLEHIHPLEEKLFFFYYVKIGAGSGLASTWVQTSIQSIDELVSLHECISRFCCGEWCWNEWISVALLVGCLCPVMRFCFVLLDASIWSFVYNDTTMYVLLDAVRMWNLNLLKDKYPGPKFNIKMSYWNRKSHCGDKTILWLSYLHDGISILVRWHLYIESGPNISVAQCKTAVTAVCMHGSCCILALSRRYVVLSMIEICKYIVNVVVFILISYRICSRDVDNMCSVEFRFIFNFTQPNRGPFY